MQTLLAMLIGKLPVDRSACTTDCVSKLPSWLPNIVVAPVPTKKLFRFAQNPWVALAEAGGGPDPPASYAPEYC